MQERDAYHCREFAAGWSAGLHLSRVGQRRLLEPASRPSVYRRGPPRLLQIKAPVSRTLPSFAVVV